MHIAPTQCNGLKTILKKDIFFYYAPAFWRDFRETFELPIEKWLKKCLVKTQGHKDKNSPLELI